MFPRFSDQCDQDTLNDKAVTMSDELRQALNQFLVMRKEGIS